MKKVIHISLFLLSILMLTQMSNASIGNQVESFEVELVLVADREAFLNEWNSNTSPPKLKKITDIKKGKSVFLYVIFKNCFAKLPDDKCAVVSEMTLKGPDGSSIKLGRTLVWNDKTPATGMYFLGRDFVEIGFSESDIPGSYEVIANVIDVNARKARLISKRFKLL